VEFFSGSQLAVAIEDIANQELLDSEEILGDRIANEVITHLPIRLEDVPRKLINGFMRGSTSFKDEQLADEIAILQRKLEDRQDPMLIVAIVKNAIGPQRKDIHIKRTQKSAVRQILRALKEELETVPTVRSGTTQSFVNTQKDLLQEDIVNEGKIVDWASRVQKLYVDLFVDSENVSTNSSFKPKGIISKLAAGNYENSWMRFIKEHLQSIYKMALVSRPLLSHSMLESEFTSMLNLERPRKPALSETIRVRIENSGQGAIKFEKTWSSKSEARQDLKAFLSLLNSLVDSNERVDSFEVSIESTNGVVISLQEVYQSKIAETLNQVLAQ
jgi:hypothetical protein